MTYVKASVRRPAGNPGNGIQPKDQLVIYDVDDILYFPPRNEAGVVIEEDIVMKAGRYAIGIYLTPGTAEISSNSDGETDAEGYTPSVKFNHPGNEQEIREFKTNWLSKKCIVVLRYCSGKPADLIGTPCNPSKLSVSYTGSNESNTNELTFTQISKGDDIAIYRGYRHPGRTGGRSGSRCHRYRLPDRRAVPAFRRCGQNSRCYRWKSWIGNYPYGMFGRCANSGKRR